MNEVVPSGWSTMEIGDALDLECRAIRPEDETIYELISIRRRHGGMFARESLQGRKILTKAMQQVVPGNFVIARRQIVHGACAIATHQFARSIMSMSYSSFKGTERCLPEYFFRLAQQPKLVKYFWDASHGVVVEKLNFQQAEWLRRSVTLPPIKEQRRIAEILDTIDETIQATERVIAKLWDLREAALVRALGNIEATSPVQPLLEVVLLPSGQVDPRVEPFRSMPLVGPEHIEGGGRGRLISFESAGSQAAISGKYRFEPGDVVYSKIRPELRKAWLANAGGVCSADMYPLRPLGGLKADYLLQVILGHTFSKFAAAVSGRSSGMPKINRTELSEFSLPVPSEPSQEQVGALARRFDHRIEAESSALRSLTRLRVGLAADLLSGRVRTVAS